ncbi:hypothetical protein GA0115246_113975, partial [Streptomyces sp. SolWspMP-sol7th]
SLSVVGIGHLSPGKRGCYWLVGGEFGNPAMRLVTVRV